MPDDALLRCFKCGRIVACETADVLLFTEIGWPWCCGDVMKLLTPADRDDLGKSDTPPDQAE